MSMKTVYTQRGKAHLCIMEYTGLDGPHNSMCGRRVVPNHTDDAGCRIYAVDHDEAIVDASNACKTCHAAALEMGVHARIRS